MNEKFSICFFILTIMERYAKIYTYIFIHGGIYENFY